MEGKCFSAGISLDENLKNLKESIESENLEKIVLRVGQVLESLGEAKMCEFPTKKKRLIEGMFEDTEHILKIVAQPLGKGKIPPDDWNKISQYSQDLETVSELFRRIEI